MHVDDYPWSSTEHKKAYLGMVFDLKSKGIEYKDYIENVDAAIAFIVLKMLEQNEYWAETVAQQVKQMRSDMLTLLMVDGT